MAFLRALQRDLHQQGDVSDLQCISTDILLEFGLSSAIQPVVDLKCSANGDAI